MGEQVPVPHDLWATGKKREHDDVKQMTLTLSPLVEVVDLFCGGGGFTEGAIHAGAKVVLSIDNWKPAIMIHKANHPNVPCLQYELGGSIVDTAVLIRQHLTAGSHFHLHGSPPCQALSNASRQNGDEGMGLVDWFLQLVDYMKPDSWSMENVVPLGKRLKAKDPPVPFVKLNSADFGVAQTRQRIFAGEGWTAEPTHEKDDWVSVIEALPHLEQELIEHKRTHLRTNTDGCGASDSRRACSVDTPIDEPIKTIHNNAVSIRNVHMDSGRSSAKTCGVNPKTGKKEGGSGFLSRSISDHPSYTITSSVKNIVELEEPLKPVRIRSLTLEESAILQGFPANMKLPYEKKRDAWVVVGNAVCPPVAEAIIRGLN